MLQTNQKECWQAVDALVFSGEIVIDRPRGSAHPRYPSMIYEVDYGYVQGTSSMDGGGIDVWRGSLPTDRVDAIICTVDVLKRDSEIKLLIGCTEQEVSWIYAFHNKSEYMKGILIKRE